VNRTRHPDASPERMEAIFRACGLRLTPEQLGQLWAYHSLLREGNVELNLTRVRNFENMVLKLYVDSVLPADLVELPSPLLDLGSGPGMPGIPLKIYRPQIEVVLAEQRGPRVDFLRDTVQRIGLTGVRVAGGRVSHRFEEPVAGVITRAVEPVAETLERVAGCLAPGGQVIFMKGPDCDAEVAEAGPKFRSRYALELDRPYVIPTTAHRRRLLVYRRLDEPLYRRKAEAMEHHTVRPIASDQNPRFKDLKKLLGGRGVRKSGQALVSGAKQVAEILARHPDVCRAWIGRGDREPPPAGSPGHLEWLQLAPELFDLLDEFGTRSPLLLVRLPEIHPWLPADGFVAGCSLLVPFQDPENVGAVVRSAAAFGAAQVILLAESAHPFHPKALRASGGAALEVVFRDGPALAELPDDLPILSLSAEGTPLPAAEFPPAFGLLAGMEGPGLPARWRRRSLRIPIRPEVESLNAAAAVSVALYEWRRRTGG
jgi:16S rRNA (guanine(527)-N(7))-methyltransferase RsmG